MAMEQQLIFDVNKYDAPPKFPAVSARVGVLLCDKYESTANLNFYCRLRQSVLVLARAKHVASEFFCWFRPWYQWCLAYVCDTPLDDNDDNLWFFFNLCMSHIVATENIIRAIEALEEAAPAVVDRLRAKRLDQRLFDAEVLRFLELLTSDRHIVYHAQPPISTSRQQHGLPVARQ